MNESAKPDLGKQAARMNKCCKVEEGVGGARSSDEAR